MPRRTQKSQDQALADLVQQRWEDAAEQRRPRETKWDEAYRDHDPAWVDESKTDPPYVKYPYLHRVTEHQVAVLLDATDANGRWAYAQPTTEGWERAREPVNQFLENTYRFPSSDLFRSNRSAHKAWATYGGKYGNGWLYVSWDERNGVTQWTNLDLMDVYIDAQRYDYIVIRRIVTLAELGDIAESVSAPQVEEAEHPDTGETVLVPTGPRDGGRALKAFRKVERSVRAGDTNGYTLRGYSERHGGSRRVDTGRIAGRGEPGAEQTRVSNEDDPFNARIVILEYYETREDGIIAKVIPSLGPDNDALVFQKETNPYGVCPIVPYVPHRVDNEFYGIGNGEAAGKLARVMDYMLRAQLRIIGAVAWPPLLVRRSANLRRQDTKDIYGQVITTRDTSDLAWLGHPTFPNLHDMGRNIAQGAADLGTGENDIRRGDVGAARNATSAAIAETASSITDKNVFREWKDSNEQLAYVTLAVSRVHMRKTQTIPLVGRDSDTFLELKPEYLKDVRWAVSFGGNPRGGNSSQQVAELLNIAQTFTPTGEANLRTFLREVLMLKGERNPDRFLMRPDPPPAMKPGEEFERLLQFGEAPLLSPQEDIFDHAKTHQVQLSRMAQEGAQSHPFYAVLYDHWQQTMQVVQQLMLAQQSAAQPGGNGNGSVPGGPGQALTGEGAAAGIDRARQQSNDNAAGASPGGTVPNRKVGGVVAGGPRR